MKLIIVPLVVAVSLFFGVPLLNEYDVNPCGAYDKLAIRSGAPLLGHRAATQDPMGGRNVAGILQGAAKGQVPQIKPVAQQAPPDPMIGLTCTSRYWQVMTGIGT